VALPDVRSVSKNLGAVRSLSDISFTRAAGEVVGLIGRQFLPRTEFSLFSVSVALVKMDLLTLGSVREAATSRQAEFMKTANHESVAKTVTRRKVT